MLKPLYLSLLLLVAGFVSAHAQQTSTSDALLGSWKFTVSDVSPEYETGLLTFEKKEEKLTGYLTQNGKLDMKELVAEGNKVSFKMDFQGGLLTITLVQEGEKLSGTVFTQDGEFPITAVREKVN